MDLVRLQISKSKEKTKYLLSNLYPTPVMNSMMTDSSSVPLYESKSCFCIIISIATKKFRIIEHKAYLDELEESLGLIMAEIKRNGLHKINSTGLRIECMTGLFGESPVNPIEFAIRIMRKCSKIPSKFTRVKIGIGSGCAQGSILSFSQKNFSVGGKCVRAAKESVALCRDEEICLDSFTKDVWLDETTKVRLVACIPIVDVKGNNNHFRLKSSDDNTTVDGEAVSTEKKNSNGDEENGMEEELTKPSLIIENVVSESADPFIRTWRENKFKALKGDLRFSDLKLEIDFQNSLDTQDKRRNTLIQLCSTTIGCFLYGLVDLSLLYINKVDWEFENLYFVYFRYSLILPVMTAGCLGVYLTNYDNASTKRKVVRQIPYVVGSTLAFYILIHAIVVFKSEDRLQHTTVDHNLFYYVEIFEVVILFASVFWITSVHATIQIILWIVYFCLLFLNYHQNIKLSFLSSVVACLALVMAALGGYIVLCAFRDYASRDDFLAQFFLGKEAEKLAKETELIEKLLMSTVSAEQCESLKNNQLSKFRFHEESIVLLVSFDLELKVNQLTLFDTISDFIALLEKLSTDFGLQIIKATSSSIMITPNIMNQEKEINKTGMIDGAITFSFEVRKLFMKVFGFLEGSNSSFVVSMDFGPIGIGVIGKKSFQFDCFGETVTTTQMIYDTKPTEQIIITERVRELIHENHIFKVEYHQRIHDSTGKDISLYSVRDEYDIWNVFVGTIDWIDRSFLVEEEKTFEIEEIEM